MTAITRASDTTARWIPDDALLVRLMDEIAAGALPESGALGQQEDYWHWREFYQTFFPRRFYPRAQAFLNSGLGKRFLPGEYLYGTAVLIRHEPSEIKLVHLLDSERFLYFLTVPRWSDEQLRAYRGNRGLRDDLWARADVKRGAGFGAELRQICHKYAVYLGQTVETRAGRPVRLLSAENVAEALGALEARLAADVEQIPLVASLPGPQDVASFALLDLFDLDYLTQLQAESASVLATLRHLADRAATGQGLHLVAHRSDPVVSRLVPRWCPADLVQHVLLFPFASQSLRSSGSGALGGDDVVFVGFLSDQLADEKVSKLRTTANLIMGTSLNELRRLLVLEQARHTSVAAIMGRNLSHNIGSHVLHWLVLGEEEAIARREPAPRGDDGADVMSRGRRGEQAVIQLDRLRASAKQGSVLRAHFLRYLRARMDYVATATRRMVRFSNSLPARALVEPFSKSKHAHQEYAMVPEQNLLLQNLVRSDGMSDVTVEGAPGPEQDVRVAIPHGMVGRQAFDTILENIIRNAAKHRNSREASANTNNFIVSFVENPEHPQYLEVLIEDDLTLWDSAAANMEVALHEGVCDPEGRPMLSRLGFKEMRISAAFLRMIDPGRVDELHYPDLISLRRRGNRVAHVFYLWRASEVLAIADNHLELTPEQLAACVRAGVHVVEPGDSAVERIATYRFVVLLGAADGKVASWLREYRDSGRVLPVRVLHSRDLTVPGACPLGDQHVRRLEERLAVAGAEDPAVGRHSEPSVTAELYDIWLSHHFGSHQDLAIAAYNPPGWIDYVQRDVVGFTDPPQDGLDAAWDVIRSTVGSRPVGVIARHWDDPATMDAFRRAHPSVRFIEGYSGNSAFQRFLADSVHAEAAALYVRELREAMLANVLLIDERLAGELRPGTGGDPELLRERRRAWHKGVWLLGAEVVRMAKVKPNGEIGFDWDVDAQGRFMFAGIHYGIIEKISEMLALERMTAARLVFDALHRIAAHVVVFSGRGRPDLPPDVRFVDYTSLEAWFKEGKRALVVGLGGL